MDPPGPGTRQKLEAPDRRAQPRGHRASRGAPKPGYFAPRPQAWVLEPGAPPTCGGFQALEKTVRPSSET
eukprot:14035395-Alexandrium_andersonii.AAC.1